MKSVDELWKEALARPVWALGILGFRVYGLRLRVHGVEARIVVNVISRISHM